MANITRKVVNDDLTALARVLGSVLLSAESLQLLRETHGRVALIVVLHLRIRVLRNLSMKGTPKLLRGSRLRRFQDQGTRHE